MLKHLVVAGALALAIGVGACGSDEDSGDGGGGGDDFLAELNAACEEGTQATIDANLELAYSTEPKDLAELSERILEAREEILSTIEGLEPPAEDQAAYEDLVAAREELVRLAEERLKLTKEGDVEALAALGKEQEKATAAEDEASAALGADACDDELPSDEAQAAEDALTEYSTTTDPATSCDSEEGLVTEAYVEGGFGGVEQCEAEQKRLAKNPKELPSELAVKEITGTDGLAAQIEYEDVGGAYDGEPTLATLYYVDGGWKLFEIRTLEG